MNLVGTSNGQFSSLNVRYIHSCGTVTSLYDPYIPSFATDGSSGTARKFQERSSVALFPVRCPTRTFSRISRGGGFDRSIHTDGVNSNTTTSPLELLKLLSERLEHMESLRGPRVTPSPIDSREGLPSTSKDTTTVTIGDVVNQLVKLYQQAPPISFPNTTFDNPNNSTCHRTSVVHHLATHCAPCRDNVHAAVNHYQAMETQSPQDPDLQVDLAIAKLQKASTASYQHLFQSLLQHDAALGMEFLLALRRDVLQWLPVLQEQKGVQNPTSRQYLLQLKQLDAHLRDIFRTWFAPGLLSVQRITYDASSAATIERIARHEAVHPMQSLDDLRERLGPNRRVFGLYHPLVAPNQQPLVVVHVSLQPDIPGAMGTIHSGSNVSGARVATFYSISNLEPSLVGVGLGEYLLQQSVERLKEELPSLQTFVTLSPMPQFREWLDDAVMARGKFHADEHLLIDRYQRQRLAKHFSCDESEVLVNLLQVLQTEGPASLLFSTESSSNEVAALVQDVMLRLAAHYLIQEKHRGRPLDGVARFHLANGATVHDIHWAANLSPKGWRTSYGMMVNYHYDLPVLKSNQARYQEEYRLPASDKVEALLSLTKDDTEQP